MKSWILVAVILQLVIIGIKTDGKYQFGDIIEFPRKCIGKKPTYSHFAIYVGGDPNDGVWRNVGQGDNDIFHRRVHLGKKGCKFDKLAKTGSKHEKKNYLDDIDPLTASRTPDKIAERIRAKNENCGSYGPCKNNCEHTATFVRYGESCSLQNGTCAGWFFKKKMDHATLEEIKARIDEVRNRDLDIIQQTDALCTSDAHKQVSWWSVLSACLALCCLLSGSCGF